MVQTIDERDWFTRLILVVLVDVTIGHTDDTNLMTLSNGAVCRWYGSCDNVSANSKSDDIAAGDGNDGTGAINLTSATVNVDATTSLIVSKRADIGGLSFK